MNSYAFSGCVKLTELILPNSVATIGYRAFYNCSKLSSINYPTALAETSSQIFKGCASLKSIVVPEGVTKIPAYAFCEADALTSVSLPSTLRAIGSNAFSGCGSLRFTILPSSVTSIGTYAFANCAKLRYVMILSPSCSIGTKAFNNSPKMFLYCNWVSDATLYAIKNNVPFQMLSGEDVDYSSYIVDMEQSSFYTSSNVAQVEEFVPMTLRYVIDESAFAQASNLKLYLTFTDSLSISANSITLDGEPLPLDDTNFEDNQLILPITKAEGLLQFSTTPIASGMMAAYAQVSYTMDNQKHTDTIGIIHLDVPLLAITVPNLTGEHSFDLTGVTAPSEKVVLQIDGAPVGECTAKKDGTFSTTVSLPSTTTHGTTHTVSAYLQSDPTIATSTTIVYSEDAPILTKFDLYYYGHDLKYLNVLSAATTQKANSIWPAKPLKFVVHFDNAESVANVFVVSTKNGVSSRMQAFPTGNEGEYVAEGFFENTSSSYVPGKLNVHYTTKSTLADYNKAYTDEELPVAWRDSTTEVLTDTNELYEASITLSNDDQVEYTRQDNVTLSQLQSALLYSPETALSSKIMPARSLAMRSGGEEWEAVVGFFKDLVETYGDNVISNAEELSTAEESDAVAVIKDDTSGTLLYVFWDSAKDAFRTEGIKFLGTNWIYENSIGVSWADSAAAWGFIANSANVVIHTYDNMISIDDASADIRSSTTLSAEQKEYALHQVDKLRWGYAATSILRMAATVSGYAFTATGHPILGTLTSTVINFAANLIDDYLDKSLAYYVAGGQGSYLKWLLDPSGYVYDANTNQRIEGVTVTAYCILYDENQADFWDTPPGDSEYGSPWDSSEYSQINPLVTDSEGCYAWDVPEGWWRVKYEKDGYATTWSEWMTVPPVQTEVNIGMDSTVVEDYAVKKVSSTATSATVFLTNNTASSAELQFVVAAYLSNGQMISCTTASATLKSTESTSITISIPNATPGVVLKAFVLDKNHAPLRDAWSAKFS